MIKNAADFCQLIENSLTDTSSSSDETVLAKVREFLEKGGAAGELVEVLEDKLTCAVCMDVPKECSITNCKHIFCRSCIEHWWLKRESCPYCNRSISNTEPDCLWTTDGIVKVVMIRHDPDYIKNREQELKIRCVQWYNEDYIGRMIRELSGRMNIYKMLTRSRMMDIVSYHYPNMSQKVQDSIDDYKSYMDMFPVTSNNLNEVQLLYSKMKNERGEILRAIQMFRPQIVFDRALLNVLAKETHEEVLSMTARFRL